MPTNDEPFELFLSFDDEVADEKVQTNVVDDDKMFFRLDEDGHLECVLE